MPWQRSPDRGTEREYPETGRGASGAPSLRRSFCAEQRRRFGLHRCRPRVDVEVAQASGPRRNRSLWGHGLHGVTANPRDRDLPGIGRWAEDDSLASSVGNPALGLVRNRHWSAVGVARNPSSAEHALWSGFADPVPILLCVVVLVAVAALAGFLPAQRASQVDPIVALR
jgi:hypothetical protein